jgi:hypothetical protein
MAPGCQWQPQAGAEKQARPMKAELMKLERPPFPARLRGARLAGWQAYRPGRMGGFEQERGEPEVGRAQQAGRRAGEIFPGQLSPSEALLLLQPGSQGNREAGWAANCYRPKEKAVEGEARRLPRPGLDKPGLRPSYSPGGARLSSRQLTTLRR